MFIMQFQSKNIHKLEVITLCYIEILLQVLFRFWFLYPTLYWAENYIHDRFDSIQSCSGQFNSIGNRVTVDSCAFPSSK